MRLDPTTIMKQLQELANIYGVRLKFDIMSPGRTRVHKGFTYEYNTKQGRPPTPTRYTEAVNSMCAAPAGWVAALYPGNYGLVCLDFDMSVEDSAELLGILPPLFRTNSRSAYDDTRETRAGHAWYRGPSKAEHLTQFTRLRGDFDGKPAVIDAIFTQLVYVPAPDFPMLLDGLIDWCSMSDEHKRSKSFPYAVKLINAERPGNRDTVLFAALAQQVWHTAADLIDKTAWYRMLQGIGYFADNPEADFDRQFDRAVQQSPFDDAKIQPFTAPGMNVILQQLGWDWRYNTRMGRAEYMRPDDTRFHSMGNKEPQLNFMHAVRSKFSTKAGKGTKPWDPIDNWSKAENWLMAYAKDCNRYDPLGMHLQAWQTTEPLSEDESLILSLMDMAPAGEDQDIMRRCFLYVEKNLLLTFYTRIVTSQTDGEPAPVHFPYLPVFVGPPGAGKSRFCLSLAHGYHSSTVRFDDPPKVYAETATVKTVLEFAELREQLGRQGSQIRGTAKAYIDKLTFDYREAYGHSSTEHHLAGVLIGTSNQPVVTAPNDGLYRRLIHLPVQKKDELGSNLIHWDQVCADVMPRALARAAKHYGEGRKPSIDENKVIRWLHKYLERWQVSETDTGWEAIGDEFDEGVI